MRGGPLESAGVWHRNLFLFWSVSLSSYYLFLYSGEFWGESSARIIGSYEKQLLFTTPDVLYRLLAICRYNGFGSPSFNPQEFGGYFLCTQLQLGLFIRGISHWQN
jgi:hypothetical protein